MTESSWLALGVSVGALLISVYAVLSGRRKDKRDVFIALWQLLGTTDLQRGRRILFELYEQTSGDDWWDAWHGLSEADRDTANRALSYFEILGYYFEREYVDRNDVLQEWGTTVRRTWEAGRRYVERRRTAYPDLWINFERLAESARRAGR